MSTRQKTEMIVVHCADTPPQMDVTVDMIRGWHQDRGWSDIGYHYLVKKDGSVHEGRDKDAIGAHVKGSNSVSIGICLEGGWEGKFDFTRTQMTALYALIQSLLQVRRFSAARVLGHCDLDSGKTCPNFDVQTWYYGRK